MPLGWVLGGLLSGWLSGCSYGPTLPQRPYELPNEEPGAADVPDLEAVREFSGSEADNSTFEWPSIYRPDGTNSVPNKVPVLWDAGGPPLLWQTDIGTGYGSPVLAEDCVVFNHRQGDHENLVCLELSSGLTRWTHRYFTDATCDFEYSDGPYSTPIIDIQRGRVYNAGGQHQFCCVDLVTGDLVWQRDLAEEFRVEPNIFPAGASPRLDGNQLVYNLGGRDDEAGIICLDVADGTTRWTTGNFEAGYCTPVIFEQHGQRFAIVVTKQCIVCLDPDTGKIDWDFEHYSRAPMSFNAVSPIVHNDRVIVVTGPGPGAVCVRILPDRSRELVWKDRRVIDCQYNGLMLAGGWLFGFTSAGQGGAEFRCVNPTTGELRWRYHSLLRRGQGLIAGDTAILLGERGHLASLHITGDEPKVISFTQAPLMAEPCYCSPVTNGRVLVLKDEQRLAVFDLNTDR